MVEISHLDASYPTMDSFPSETLQGVPSVKVLSFTLVIYLFYPPWNYQKNDIIVWVGGGADGHI